MIREVVRLACAVTAGPVDAVAKEVNEGGGAVAALLGERG
jgi:hypothetical protein